MVAIDGAYVPRREFFHGPVYGRLALLGVRAAEFRMKYHIPLKTRARNTRALQEAIEDYSYSHSWPEEKAALEKYFEQWRFIARNWGYEVNGLIEAAEKTFPASGLQARYRADFKKLDRRFSKLQRKLQERGELKRLISMHIRSLAGADPESVEEEPAPKRLATLMRPLIQAEERFFDKPTEKRLNAYLVAADELSESKEYRSLVPVLRTRFELDPNPKVHDALRDRIIAVNILEGASDD